jgi:hypothetical protein
MKAKTIKKLRNKISKKGYYEKRWSVFADKCREWDRFNDFKCNSFFVGEHAAKRNQWMYDKYGRRDMAKCDYYRRKVTGEERL